MVAGAAAGGAAGLVRARAGRGVEPEVIIWPCWTLPGCMLPLNMATTVILRHKDGRRIPIGTALNPEHAARVKADIERWLASTARMSLAMASGVVEDLTPRSVVAIEMIDEQEHLDG